MFGSNLRPVSAPRAASPTAPLPVAGGSGFNGMGYSSGITSGPVWGDSALAQHLGQMQSNMQAPSFAHTPFASPAQKDFLHTQAQDGLTAEYQRGKTDLQRGAAQANAAQVMGSQQARSNAGIQGGSLLQRLQEQNWEGQQPIQNFLLSMLLGGAS